jgi:trans-aconitate 2-methyltransferase
MGSSSTHWDPVEYSANSDLQFAITTGVLADVAFNGDEHVLDVGCGDGRISRQLAQRVPNGRVLGVDSSASMIRFAQTNHASQSNLSFVLKDACEIDFMNEFDAVVSTFCLQWVSDKAAAFAGIRKSLRKGGTAVLIMPFRNPTIAMIREQMTREARWSRSFAGYTDPSDNAEDKQYDAYATQAGFAINSYRIGESPGSFGDIESFASFLGALTPHLERIPAEAEKKAFMGELVARYLAADPSTQSPGGHVTYRYVYVTLIATATP